MKQGQRCGRNIVIMSQLLVLLIQLASLVVESANMEMHILPMVPDMPSIVPKSNSVFALTPKVSTNSSNSDDVGPTFHDVYQILESNYSHGPISGFRFHNYGPGKSWGIVSTKDWEEGEEIYIAEPEKTITLSSVIKFIISLDENSSKIRDDEIRGFKEDEAMVAMLIHRVKDCKSYSKLIDYHVRDLYTRMKDFHVTFSKEHVKRLKPSVLTIYHNSIKETRVHLLEKFKSARFEELFPFSCPHLHWRDVVTKDLIKWAHSIVSSRIFTPYAFIPFVEMANSCEKFSECNVEALRDDDGRYLITTTKPISEGEEIKIVYVKNNPELLSFYGFCTDFGDQQDVELNVADPLYERAISNSAIKDNQTIIEYIEQSCDVVKLPLKEDERMPDKYLKCLRLVELENQELFHTHRLKTPVSKNNEIRAHLLLKWLLTELDSKHRTLEEYEAEMKQEGIDYISKCISMIKRDERKAIDLWLPSIDDMIWEVFDKEEEYYP